MKQLSLHREVKRIIWREISTEIRDLASVIDTFMIIRENIAQAMWEQLD